MKLGKENLAHINSISHDGKVLLFGTDVAGIIWYTVKQSGFEDSVFSVSDDDAVKGFEVWKKLPLGESTYDASIVKKFKTLLVPVFGKDQTGKENSQAVKSAKAPVQLVSGMGYLHVFRQSLDYKLLVNRFVLDGMTNELSPKLDVRFKRSRQKYEVSENMKMEKDTGGNATLKNVDAPDFKDMDGNPFYEPAWKLDFIGNLDKGWFSAVLLSTIENEKYRWSIFAYDSSVNNVVLYNIRASHSGIFDVKDYHFIQPSSNDSQSKSVRTIHGIIKRTLKLKNKSNNNALKIINGLAATAYNVQKERVGDDGKVQFLKDATRVMLAMPVKEEVTDAGVNSNIAVLSFAVGSAGTLSQVGDTPNTKRISAKVNELILPLNTLDEVKEFIQTTPPPSGVVTGVQTSAVDMVTILSRNLPETLNVGEKVKISGTKNYNGLHEVINVIDEVDGSQSFEISATFNNSEAGFWEVVPEKQTGLIFDNMIVSYKKAGDGGNRLKITCPNHKLEIGDEVQVTGTRKYDGLYPVKAIDDVSDNFTIDMDYQPGEVVDLKAKKRRGIRFGGSSDYLRTGSVKLDAFSVDTNVGRTVSAWVWLESERNHAQLVVGQEDQVMELRVGDDNKMQLLAHLSDDVDHIVKDPDDLPPKAWIHYAGVVEYQTGKSNKTCMFLCRNGVKVNPTAEDDETVVEKEKLVANCIPVARPRDAFIFGGTKLQKLPDNIRVEVTYSETYTETVVFNQLPNIGHNRGYFSVIDYTLKLGNRFTQEFWIHLNSSEEDSFRPIVGNGGGIGDRSPSVFVRGRRIHAGYTSQQGIWTHFTSEPVIPLWTWTHVAVTFDGTCYNLYINGRIEMSINVINTWWAAITRDPQNNAVTKIGSSYGYGGSYINIQELRMWNKARSADDIRLNMNRRFRLSQDALVANYHFDKLSVDGSLLPDLSGHGFVFRKNGPLTHTSVSTLELSQKERLEETITTPGQKRTVPRRVAVEIPKVAPIDALTLTYWIKTNSSSTVDLVTYTPSYSRTGTTFTIDKREFSITNPSNIHIYVNNVAVSTNVTVSDGEWHHLAVSWESENGVLVIHKDGEQCFSASNFQKGQTLSQAPTSAFILGSNGTSHLAGSLGQLGLWSTFLSVSDIKRLMHSPLTGEESNLIGAWVYGRGRPYDLTQLCAHGTLYDDAGAENIDKLPNKTQTVRLLVGGAGEDVGSFVGKLSDLRLWNTAQDEKTIKDSIHIPLSGLEDDLVGNWRMGAIVTEKGEKQVPDFSKQSNNALVHGTPFVTERSLNRRNTAGKKVVKYANHELVAVSHRARYRESFEFRVLDVDHNAWTLDKLKNADGRNDGLKIFEFAYWGKASRSSEKSIPFSTEVYTQDEFKAVAGAPGWFHASCEFEVPDGVSMVRSFEVRNVQGLWASQATPPTAEWTEMEVRKHQIVHVSDAITRREYVDDIRLSPTLENSSASLYNLWARIRSLELCEADISRHLQHLMLRMDIVESKEKYQTEKTAKQNDRARLRSEIDGMTSRESFLGTEISRLEREVLRRSRAFQNEMASHLTAANNWSNQVLMERRERDRRYNDSKDWFNTAYDLRKMNEAQRRMDQAQSTYNHYIRKYNEAQNNRDREIGDLNTAKQSYEKERRNIRKTKPQIESSWRILDDRIKLLAKYTSLPLEDVTTLRGWKNTTQEGLQRVRNDLNSENTEFLSILAQSQQQPQAMQQVAPLDSRKLVTEGALLTFASPKSRLHALESSRGNVEVNYFDSLENLQCTVFDATADSRNSTFEQWLPASLRPAVEFRNTADRMQFEEGKTILMTDQWTLETWFQYPLVAQSSGNPYERQVLIEDSMGRQIVVERGKYLGARADGAFFETGIDLEKVVAQGWHHLAVTLQREEGLVFFLDGKRRGATPKKHAITFAGDSIAEYVKWSNFANFPTTEITVAMWMKSLGRNDSPVPLSYAISAELNEFLLHNINSMTISLGGLQCHTSVHLNDGFWHHLAVTWESANGSLKVYKDGHLVHDKVGFKQGYTLGGNGTLILGQEQDSLGGGFDDVQAFDGSLRGVSIWNTVRDLDAIKSDMYVTFTGNEANLVGYWSMETEGGKLKDLHAAKPQHGEICGTPKMEIVSVIKERYYEIKTMGNSAEGGAPFGRLAETRLWKQCLSEEEIETHAQVNNLTGDEPGLVAYYPMNESSGTLVRDHSRGTKIHGVLSGADWKACTGDMNKAASYNTVKVLSLDGTNDFVEIPGLRGKLDGNELTIEYWFKGTSNQSVVRQQREGAFIVSAWYQKHILSDDGSTSNGSSTGDVENDQWHHVAMTWKKGAADGFVSYVDGEEVAKRNAGSTALPVINASVYLGSKDGTSQFTNGLLAEVRIWKKARTKEEIIANMHRRLTGKESGLKACYPLDSFMEIDGELRVRDITSNNYHGEVHGATLVTADIFITGDIDKPEVLYFNGSGDLVDLGVIDIANKSFSFESWVKNSSPGTYNIFVTQGTAATRKGLLIGFRDDNKLIFTFYEDALTSDKAYSDKAWHHIACTYDHSSRTQTLYWDGVQVGQRISGGHYSGSGHLYLGRPTTSNVTSSLFKGALEDIRVWKYALSREDIISRKDRRLSGKEQGLLAYWPTGDLDRGKLNDRSAKGTNDATISGAKLVESSGGFPFNAVITDLAEASVTACEYATMGRGIERPALKTCMLRSFRAYSTKPGNVEVFPDLRIEALELKWVGNAQFKPTLLGFIEGAPPVPSENLTVDYDYNNATSVSLRESKDVSYSWNRTKDTSQGLDLDLFVGAGWGVSGGIGIETKISEGRAGFKGSLNTRFVDSNSSSVFSGSTISFNDTLALRGEQERGTKFSHLGKRFVPKNVGYALVVSGLADIFISCLAHSGRMISYEMRPVEGVPLDVNTITFQINPTYIMNGSLDGLTGSNPTSGRFFRHVPEMRVQYGSLYPASYYRIREAYDLKEQIERWDKDREAYFWNFDVTWRPGVDVDRQIADSATEESYGQVSVKREEDTSDDGDKDKKQDEKLDKIENDMEKEKDKAKAKAEQRRDEIEKRFADPEARERASSALSSWQSKMENLLVRAGKRNIVNTYVWDANGGMRAESQDFANTIEHTIGSNFTIGGTLGGLVDAQIAAFQLDLTALYAGELTQTSSKTENIGRTFGLDVDVYGVESKEVVNLDGKPLKPGEKVGRYRFMSFYLGGNTDNFHDFFDYVVDAEWLTGNSEGARALRQAKSGKPNKAWRVLHRVTYVERPSLEGVGIDTRATSGEDQIADRAVSYFDSIEKQSRATKAELDAIRANLTSLLAEVRALKDRN